MSQQSQSLEGQREEAVTLERARHDSLIDIRNRAIQLSAVSLRKVHSKALQGDAERIDRMNTMQQLITEINRHGFEWGPGEVESIIKKDNESMKFIADKKAGKFI